MTDPRASPPTHRLLVTYASEFGATAQVAATIAATLRDAATAVDCAPVVDVDTISAYQAVIIGSPIYNGAWLPEAVHFVQFFAQPLSRLPVAYFVVSMRLAEDTPAHRALVLSYLDPLRAATPAVQPVAIGLFAGQLRYRNLPLLERVWFWLRARLPSGDFRNEAQIRAWADTIRPLIK